MWGSFHSVPGCASRNCLNRILQSILSLFVVVLSIPTVAKAASSMTATPVIFGGRDGFLSGDHFGNGAIEAFL